MTSNSSVVLKSIKILQAFANVKNEWGVNELSRYLDIPVSSLHRILKTLRDENILDIHIQSGKYVFGSEMIRIASVVNAKSDIKLISEPYLRELSSDLDETVYLASYYSQHKKLAFIHHIQGTAALQYVLEIGVLQPVHIAASGKAILAFLPDEEINAVFEQEKLSAKERASLKKELMIIQQQGFSFSESERKKGSIGFGAPIFNAKNQVIGSIICAIPANLYDENKKDTIISRLLQTAEKISYSLGSQISVD